MNLTKRLSELIQNVVEKKGYQRILFKSKFIDQINFGKTNFNGPIGYNTIIVSKTHINKQSVINQNEIHYTSNFNDLMYYRNSDLEIHKKFIAIIPENWVVLESIQEAAYVYESLEFELIRYHLQNGPVIIDDEGIDEIINIFTEYYISYENFNDIINSNNIHDIKRITRCFDKINLNETKKTLNKANKILESNDEEFKELLNTKSPYETAILKDLRNKLIANFNPKHGFENSVFESASNKEIYEKLLNIQHIDLDADINKKINLSGLEQINQIGNEYAATTNNFCIQITDEALIESIQIVYNENNIDSINSNNLIEIPTEKITTNLLIQHKKTKWKKEIKIIYKFNGFKLRFTNGNKIITAKHSTKAENHTYEVSKIDFNKDTKFEILSWQELTIKTDFETSIINRKNENLFIYKIQSFNSDQLDNLFLTIDDNYSNTARIELKITPADVKSKIKNYTDEIEKRRIRQSGFLGEIRYLDNNDPLDKYWAQFLKSNGIVGFISLDELITPITKNVNSNYIKTESVDLGIVDTPYGLPRNSTDSRTQELYNDYQRYREKIIQPFKKFEDFNKIKRDLLIVLSEIDKTDIDNYVNAFYKLIKHSTHYCNIDTIYLLKPETESNRRLGQYNICGSILPFFHPICIEHYYKYSLYIPDNHSPSLLKSKPKLIEHYVGPENEIYTRVENNSHLYSIFISSINGNFRSNHQQIRNSTKFYNISTVEDNVVLGHSDIIKALDSLFNYIPFKYSYNIAILGKSDFHIENIIGEYLNDINDLDNLDYIEIRVYDFRDDVNELDEDYLGLYTLNSKYKLIWYAVKRNDELTVDIKFDLLLDLSLEMDMTPKKSINAGTTSISTDNVLTSVCQTSYVQNNKFTTTYYNNFNSPAVNYFINKSDDPYIFIREYYNSTSVQGSIYQSSKLIATTAQGYYHISNDPSNNMLLYELQMSNNDYQFGNKGDFYLTINENRIFQDRLHVAFESILKTVPNELEISKFLMELRDLNLFQFKFFLSSRNKTQGLIGEAWIFKNYYQSLIKLYGNSFVMLPYDLIHENLYNSLAVNGELKDRHHPDFLCLSFSNGCLNIQFLEVKTYLNSPSPRFNEIYAAQILPVQTSILKWITKCRSQNSSVIAFKLQILQLFEICSNNYGNNFKINDNELNNWLNQEIPSIKIKEPILFYISSSEEYEKWKFDNVEYDTSNRYLLVKCSFSEINPSRLNSEIDLLFSKLSSSDELTNLEPLETKFTQFDSETFKEVVQDVKKYKTTPTALSVPKGDIEHLPLKNDPLEVGTILKEETKRKMVLVAQKLRAFKINIYPKIDSTIYGPSSIKCYFEMDSSVSINSIINKDDDIAIALMLDRGQSVIVDHEKGLCTIEFPRADSDRVYFDIYDILHTYNRSQTELVIPFGIDSQGKPVAINFSSSQTPHLLIGGQTGSGKSIALKTILTAATKLYTSQELNLTLVDPKKVELISFSDLPHLTNSEISPIIGSNSEDTIDYLKKAIEIMENRYDLFQQARVTNLNEFNLITSNTLRRHLIVLDEYADIVSNEDLRSEVESLLEKLSQKARAAGIHLIITTQKPSAKVLSTVIRSNLPAQLALKVSRVEDSRVILGDNSGAQKLNGKGDALFNNGSGSPIRLQVANS